MTEISIDSELLQIVELLLTASNDPLTQARLNQILEGRESNLKATVDALNDRFEMQERPFEIVNVAGGYQMVSKPEYRHHLQRLFQKSGKLTLSRAALEAMAIIAYRQPITKGDIEQIRGVGSDSVVKSLLEKELITVKGRYEGPGRPLLYGTTASFLEGFGLATLHDLPKLREIEEIMGESAAQMKIADAPQ